MPADPNHQALDPKNTLAILIGVQKYDDPGFPNIEPALKNVSELKKVLLDDSIFGIPEGNIHEFINGKDVEIEDELEKLTKAAKKSGISTILFYFTGHGYKRTDKKYYLATTNSRKSRIDRSGKTAISFEELESIFKDSQIRQSIIVLDACFSGIIAQGEDEVIEAKPWRGSYRLTSSHATEKSYFDLKDDHTVFTGELLRIFREGSAVDREKLSLEELYLMLKEAVSAKNPDMVPQQRPSEEIAASKYQFFKNRKYDGEADLIRKFEADLEEDIKVLKAGNHVQAKRSMVGLKEEIIEILNDSPARNRLLKKVDAEIEICRNYRKYQAYIAPAIKKKYEAELSELKAKIAEQKSQHAAALKKLVAEKENMDEALSDYDVRLEQTEEQLAEAIRKENARAIENKKLDETIQRLKQEIGQLESQIVELEKAPSAKKSLRDFSEAIGSESIEMIFVEGGTFLMGSSADDSEGDSDEKPQHSVKVSDFHLGKYPVTQAQWKAVMGSDPEELGFKGCDQCPVESVSWNGAQEFLEKLNAYSGKKFRLPTEAEWEYAARGGKASKGYTYAGGNNLDSIGWYGENAESKTHSVGGKEANELGLYDMSGNVFEWCSDWHGVYPQASQNNPKGPETGENRVIRGGSWINFAQYCRVAYRNYWPPGLRFISVGFRLAHSL